MKKRLTRMTHSLRSLSCSPGRATGKRITALGAALLVTMGLGARTASAGALDALREEDRAALSEAVVIQTLDKIKHEDAYKGRVLYVRDWVIHPDGFAFRVPENMKASESNRGKASIIMEDQTGGDQSFHTVISIVVMDEKESLEGLTAEKVRAAHLAQNFPRFELLDFEKETLLDTEGVCYSYLTGSAPQLLVQQRMFDMGGQRYMITMTVENRINRVCAGLGQMAELLDSLLFCENAQEAQAGGRK